MTGSFSRSKLTLTLFILSASFGVFYSISENPKEISIVSPVVLGTTVVQGATPPKSRFDFLTRFVLPKKAENNSSSGTVLGEKTKSPATEPSLSVSTPTPTPTPSDSYLTPTPTVTPTPSSFGALTLTTPTPTSIPLTPNQTSVIAGSQDVINLLVSRDFQKLYDLMNAEFKSVFSKEDFISSFSSSTDVSSGELIEVPVVYGGNLEWAEQLTKLSLNDGTIKKYLLIFHRENNVWKLYGTEDKS